MLKKSFRFHGHASLKFVLGKGKSVRVQSLQLKCIENTRRADNRLAIVVSKKVAKKAPVRNRIRRRIYEAVRLHWPMLKTPYDLVISVYDQQVAEMDSKHLNRLVAELLHKASLYK